MTGCPEWLDELQHAADRILNEDLAALQRIPSRTRIERYNDIKADEEELIWEFSKECPSFLTDTEEDRLRGELRLARLLLAASFYAEGNVPRAIEGDFTKPELQAVVDFDRYKQFDILDEDQIEGRIRRMEGEVYDLVRNYTSTQIANMDELVNNPDVQQDVIDRLVKRYETRRNRIRQGFFIYVETYGLEHMVENIEQAVEAVADASEERKQVRETLRRELQELETTIESGFENQRQKFESRLRQFEHDIASETVDPTEIRTELTSIGSLNGGVLSELRDAIDRAQELESTLDEQISDLETARKNVDEADEKRAREEATEIVEAEIERMNEQRSSLRAEIERLQREREAIETTRDRLNERQQALQNRAEEMEHSDDRTGGIEGADVVTSATARLFEMDYIGRFNTTIHEAESLELPGETFEIPDGYWTHRSSRRSDAPRVDQLLEDAPDRNYETYPRNPSARYEITESQYLGLMEQPQMIVEAAVFSDLEAHAARGFDATPADLDNLLAIVNDVVREADIRDVTYLLGIASPTGWTDAVEERVVDDIARSKYSRRVSVCLVDLRDGNLIYDSSDPLVTSNIELFERAIKAERVEECAETISREYISEVGRGTVGLDEIAEEYSFERHVIKQAFERLEAAGEAEQFYVDEDGLAVDVS